jgi:predicted NBD/HSP70 family sugar kinase
MYLGHYLSGKGVEDRTGKKPRDIDDPAFWDSLARYLAFGLNNTIVHWSPDALVLGGSMITGDPAIPIEKIEENLKDILKIFPELPVIKKGELGTSGGLWGALAYAREEKI